MRVLALLLTLLNTQIFAEFIKIGYIDIDRVIENSSLYKAANEKLIAEFEPRKNILVEQLDDIIFLKEKIKLPNDVVDDIKFINQLKIIHNLEDEFQSKSEIWQKELNQSQFNLLSEIEIIINNAINTFAKLNKYDLILYENGAFVGPNVDISDDIILLIEKQ
jgi:outer membrane protein